MSTNSASDLQILNTVRLMQSAESADEIVQHFSRAVETVGATGVFIGHIVDYETLKRGKPMRVATWPTELLQARIESRAVLHDPVIAYALKTNRPFRWDQAIEHANRYGRKITNSARDYGLKDGMMFPIFDVDSTRGAVSIGGEKLTLTPADVMPLSLLASHCYTALERIVGPFPFEISANLTAMETDVLHFAAAGKTAWETSQILHLTEDAVKASIKRARRKLGAVTTGQAIAVAMRKNLIV